MSQPITTAGTCRVAVEERPRCQRIARNEPSVLQGDEEHVGAWKRLNHVVGGGFEDRSKHWRRESLQLCVMGFSTALGHAYLLLAWILGLWEKLHCME